MCSNTRPRRITAQAGPSPALQPGQIEKILLGGKTTKAEAETAAAAVKAEEKPKAAPAKKRQLRPPLPKTTAARSLRQRNPQPKKTTAAGSTTAKTAEEACRQEHDFEDN